MELTKKEKTIKYLVYCGIIAVSALLQNVAGLWFEIGGARCFWLLPVAVLLSLDEDEKVATLLGLFAGVLWDVVAGAHYGFNAVFIMVCCYLMSTLISHLLRATYLVGIISSMVVTFLYVTLYWLLFVAITGGEGSKICYLSFYLPSFFYTAFVTVLLNIGFVPMKKALNKGTK